MQHGNPYQAKQGEALIAQEGKCQALFSNYREELLATLKIKEAEGALASQASAPRQSIEAPAAQSPTAPISPDTKYCATCTPVGRNCPNEFPVSSDWDDNLGEEERKDQDKRGGNEFPEFLDWDENLKEQERKNQEMEDKRTVKTPSTSPIYLSATTLTPQPQPLH